MSAPETVFIGSAANKAGWPDHDLDEVVIVGRSNVGKSSFINALLRQKKLAYTGKTPGKTQLINFFGAPENLCIVDVPGYGYARLSKQQLERIGHMMEEYFSERKNLKLAVVLHDSRHGPTKDDLDMVASLEARDIPILHVATKADKQSRNQRDKQRVKSAQKLGVEPKNILYVSSLKKDGLEPVWDRIVQTVHPDSTESATESA